MFEAVVFDMDGVILDSEKIYRIYEKKAAEHFGLPTDHIDDFCCMIAGGTKATNAIAFKKFFNSDINYLDYRDIVSAGVEKHGEENGYELKPGVQELFDFLKERGVKMALATSTERERAEKFLGPHGLLPYFDKMIFGNSIPADRGKPNPDIYLKACEMLCVDPAKTIGVEDSVNGTISSFDAGLYTVMVVDLVPPNDITRAHTHQIYDVITQIEELFE